MTLEEVTMTMEEVTMPVMTTVTATATETQNGTPLILKMQSLYRGHSEWLNLRLKHAMICVSVFHPRADALLPFLPLLFFSHM